jgi:hypothetical protein
VRCKEERLSGLDVRVTPLMPLGILVIDGELDTGRMAVIPTVPHGIHPQERPQLILGRSWNTTAFSYYWKRLTSLFSVSTPLDIDADGHLVRRSP